MSEKRDSNLKWWERVLHHCFRSTASTMATGYTIILVPVVVAFLLTALGFDHATAKEAATISFAVWVCILVAALDAWDQITKHS